MPVIHFLHQDGSTRTIEAPIGLSVMEIALKNQIAQIEGTCGGSLSCATCHVYVHPDWWDRVLQDAELSDEENDMLDLAFDLKKSSRLSCQIIMRPDLDGLIVALPGSSPAWPD